MNYAKLYVDVYTHPRFIKAGFEASGYWMHALAYLRHHESSDGFLAEEAIAVPLAANKAQCRRLCEKLVSVGLFRRVESGYVLLRYAEKNETKADILLAKAEARERKARSRRRGAAAPPATPPSPPPGAREPSHLATTVTRDMTASARQNAPEVPSQAPSSGDVSRVTSVSASALFGSDLIGSESGSDSGCGLGARPPGAGDDPPAARPPLPPSERALSGPYWLAAFTEGITEHTGRPCTAGRMYLSTLERIVAHHAPERSAERACAWLRDQARGFAAKWDGHHPPRGLTPDGLERWLNEGRGGPPLFGKPRLVQLPPEEWKADDFSDLGAVTITGASNGTGKSHE